MTKTKAGIPTVKGLILAGGKSKRMGTDKGLINYHGTTQIEYLKGIFTQLNVHAYISCREGQYTHQPQITDDFEGFGPFGAIVSAQKFNPAVAWLTVACDMPMVDKTVILTLLKERDHTKIATCFHNPHTGLPDPLLTIWEPSSAKQLLKFKAIGIASPREVLKASNIKEVQLSDSSFLLNVNTPSELDSFKKNS